jgi:hypothetical protein
VSILYVIARKAYKWSYTMAIALERFLFTKKGKKMDPKWYRRSKSNSCVKNPISTTSGVLNLLTPNKNRHTRKALFHLLFFNQEELKTFSRVSLVSTMDKRFHGARYGLLGFERIIVFVKVLRVCFSRRAFFLLPTTGTFAII